MWDTLCKTSCGLTWDQSQIWTPVLQNPRQRWSWPSGKAEAAHHTCWEVQSCHALSCLSTATPSPKGSEFSSGPFFIAAGYKTLVTSETTQIQCLNPETTTMTITDFQSKAAKRSSTHWVLLGEKWLWESANCSQVRLSDTCTVLEKNKSQENATVGTSVLPCCQDSSY